MLIPATQAEAERRACPFAVTAGGGCCVAARCMAWTWHDAETEFSDRTTRPPGEGWEPGRLATWRRPRDPLARRGRCGMVPHG